MSRDLHDKEAQITPKKLRRMVYEVRRAVSSTARSPQCRSVARSPCRRVEHSQVSQAASNRTTDTLNPKDRDVFKWVFGKWI